jgi:hypothetical protein
MFNSDLSADSTEELLGKRVAIMQPYFFPYIGYFQLISAVDQFVVYDNIKYTKKGWINRNHIIRGGRSTLISLPMKAASDACLIIQRELSKEFDPQKLLKQIRVSYLEAPYFNRVEPVLNEILVFPNNNLFFFLRHSLEVLCHFLGIKTELITSSHVEIDHTLKGEQKVIQLCKELSAKHYINLPGGKALYSKENFEKSGISLNFIESRCPVYSQFETPFQASLSIIDLMMFNSQTELETIIKNDFIFN